MADQAVPTREQLKKLKVTTLRQRLSKLSLPQGGLKDDLITRLIEHYKEAQAAAQEVLIQEAAEREEEESTETEEQETSGQLEQEGQVEDICVKEEEKTEDEQDEEQTEPEKLDQQIEPADQDLKVEPEQMDEPVPAEGVEQQVEPVKLDKQVIPDVADGGVQVQQEDCPEQQNQDVPIDPVGGDCNERETTERGDEREKEEEQAMEVDETTPMEEETTIEVEGGENPGRERAEPVKERVEPVIERVEPVIERVEPVIVRVEPVSIEQVVQAEARATSLNVADPVPAVSQPNKPRPLMETILPQMTSDYYSASDGNREDENVSMATEEIADRKVNEMPSATTEVAKEGKRKKKKKRRRRRHDQPSQTNLRSKTKDTPQEKVVVEYIQEDILKPDDPYFRTFFRVFENFRIQEPEVKKTDTPTVSDLVAKAALESKRLAARRQEDSDEEEEEEEGDKEQPKISKKKLRRMNRLSVAQLKQLVERPDVVEMHDVTAPDPQLLIHLKSTRNTVPVPRHWCFKRKYLQGKRGIEKPPFDLPDFIKATGVMDMRQAIEDKEDAKSLKQKTRERVRPKMGKLTIDYQKLHDAFFKWQTKPKMSIHGDLYYEGKEFETRLRLKKPGDLSDELRRALGMPTGLGKQRFPPPWLVAMQRYGPPPSYPNLKIPGLNNPIPEGCSFGYFVGGWGKPPVDERGRPLYGDVFGLDGGESAGKGIRDEEEVDQTFWGELESEEEEEESEEESEEEEGSPKPEDIQAGLVTPVEGLATPSGLTSIPAGLETPEMIQLRKKKIEEAMEQGGETPALYTVLPEKTASVGGAMMGSSHVYDVASAVPGAIKKTSGSSHEGIEVALDPSELDLDTATMSARYEEQLREQQGHLQKEDLSDMVAEHAAKQKKRKRPAADSGGGGKATKKLKEFKF